MNSVDFQLRCTPGADPQLLLLHPRGRHRDFALLPLESERAGGRTRAGWGQQDAGEARQAQAGDWGGSDAPRGSWAQLRA